MKRIISMIIAAVLCLGFCSSALASSEPALDSVLASSKVSSRDDGTEPPDAAETPVTTEPPQTPDAPAETPDATETPVPESSDEPSPEPTKDPQYTVEDPGNPFAEGEARVVMGADLSEEQRAQVYNAFGIESGSVRELTVTNAEERFYFEGKLPDEKLGHKAISCIYITALEKGKGLDIKTHNINYCTVEMYKNVLVTVGITDARIVVASPYPVSGTAALTGIYKAYEDITGKLLGDYAKLAGIEELLVTGQLAELIGSDDATEIINELKKILDVTVNMSDEEVKQKIRDIADDYNVELTENQIDQLLALVRTFEGLDVEQIRQRALSLVKAASGWQKVTEAVQNTFEGIGNFFKQIGQFFRELFEKWFS